MDYAIKTLSQLRPILQGFRKSAALTQAAMASQLGVTQQTYAQLEANPAAVSVERLFRVLRILQVDLKLTQDSAANVDTTAADYAAVSATADRAVSEAWATVGTERVARTPRKSPTSASKPTRASAPAKRAAKPAPRKTGGKLAATANKTRPTKPTKAPQAAGGKKREEW
ncbi:helix-turn-helix transcriptional regulator [Paraburkholderia antibiotica]|uniref:Helix-turn-helix transcriptional regulator n=1 Tax=Paraburkholderia antibiotica TaxID=2728839 RepID=A0A7Y0A2K5_9BURK|nr:helix-turn-helix transcriptional regulator [Paraburkholderia antibiotica]NML35352.1 helix-turn-helix transcriptional regulator [Paraburkholderia antibiotica]